MEREWNENKDERNFDESSFENSYERLSYDSKKISVERLTFLFENGNITAREYSFLLQKLYPTEKRTSYFAIASLLCAALNWILMLKFTVSGEEYQLLTGQGRQTAGTILAPLAVIFFFLAAREINKQENIKGLAIAAADLAIATVILTIVMSVYLIDAFK